MSLRHLYRDLSFLKIYGDVHSKVISDSYVYILESIAIYGRHDSMFMIRNHERSCGLQWIREYTHDNHTSYSVKFNNIIFICYTKDGKVIIPAVRGKMISDYNGMEMSKEGLIEIVMSMFM